jgi:hypothetical protein
MRNTLLLAVMAISASELSAQEIMSSIIIGSPEQVVEPYAPLEIPFEVIPLEDIPEQEAEVYVAPKRPSFVITVPFTVDENQTWTIAKRDSDWWRQWVIPFNKDGTQFIPATLDTKDFDVLDKFESIEDASDFFQGRYGSQAVALIGLNSDSTNYTVGIKNGRSFDIIFSDHELVASDASSVRSTVSLALDEALTAPAYSQEPTPQIEDASPSDVASTEDGSFNPVASFRVLGSPVMSMTGLQAKVQIIGEMSAISVSISRSYRIEVLEVQEYEGTSIWTIELPGSTLVEDITGALYEVGIFPE